ncbi:MAG: peptidylprolyl isomerase [Burkholderiales bacterium]|nr:peptidylprolyl isomerase [Burkholderiales bacterium]MCJ7838261.1 peptidylprolyl isomerase [Burkholderiales bacterium]
MKHLLTSTALIAFVALTASVSALAAKSSAKDSIATVNGKAISKSRLDAVVAMHLAQGQKDSEELRKTAKNELVDREVLEQEARKQGFGKKPEVVDQMEMARQGILINAYMHDYVNNHPISEDMLKKEYETFKAQLGDKEYKARHILVEKEDVAKDIIARLNKGEKFEELAKQSKDTATKDHGGELGWATPSRFVRPFSEAMVKLEKGKYSQTPVKTKFGYHVIALDDTRATAVPSFEASRAQLLKRLQAQLVATRVAELRGKAKIE